MQTPRLRTNLCRGTTQAFPSGEGGPLAVDEENAASTYDRLSHQTHRGELRAPAKCKMKIQTPRIRTHTVRPYEFVRRARSFGRVAPSRMTHGFQECKHSARFPRMQAFGAEPRFSPTANPAAMRKWLPYKRLLPRGSSAVGGEGVSLPK